MAQSYLQVLLSKACRQSFIYSLRNHMLHFNQRLVFIILRIDFFHMRCNITVIIRKNSLCSNKMLILMNAANLSFSFFFVWSYWDFLSEKLFSIMYGSYAWKWFIWNYYYLSNTFSLIMHHYFLNLVRPVFLTHRKIPL